MLLLRHQQRDFVNVQPAAVRYIKDEFYRRHVASDGSGMKFAQRQFETVHEQWLAEQRPLKRPEFRAFHGRNGLERAEVAERTGGGRAVSKCQAYAQIERGLYLAVGAVATALATVGPAPGLMSQYTVATAKAVAAASETTARGLLRPWFRA